MIDAERVTDTECGPVFHRPATRLVRGSRCVHGHVGWRYGRGECVACANIRRHGAVLRNGQLRRFTSYAAAVAWHEEVGGYLFRHEALFCVTDSPRCVARLRGADFLRRMDRAGVWDEIAGSAQLSGTAKARGTIRA